MNHKRRRAKHQRAGGARHGGCKPYKVVGNSESKGDRFGKRTVAAVRKMLRTGDE